MSHRYYSVLFRYYRVSKQKSTRDSRSTSCKQLMKNEQSHLESNTSGILGLWSMQLDPTLLDNRQTAGAQGEQHFRHSERWTSDVEFGPGLFWQAGLVCAKYFCFFWRHTFITVLIGILICESTSNERPVQCRDDLDHAVENFRQVRAKHQSNCWLWSGQTRQHVWTSGSFGESCVLLPLPFSGSSQVCEGFAAPMMARSFFFSVSVSIGAARHGHHGDLGNSRGGSGRFLALWWIWSCGDRWFITKDDVVDGDDDDDDVHTLFVCDSEWNHDNDH